MVPYDLQREVYRTVELRGPDADETWAPWWRAQALAIAAVREKVDPKWDKTKYLDREFKIADHLEGKTNDDSTRS